MKNLTKAQRKRLGLPWRLSSDSSAIHRSDDVVVKGSLIMNVPKLVKDENRFIIALLREEGYA